MRGTTAGRRRKQKGVEAIFSPLDKSKNSYKQIWKTQWNYDRATHPVSVFLFLQAFFIVISLFWLVYIFQSAVHFGNKFYEAFSYYLPPISLLSVGLIGLGLSIAWGIANYRRNRSSLDFPARKPPERDLIDLSETDSRSS